MGEELSIEQGAQLIKNLSLPPCPTALAKCLEESAKPVPDQGKLAATIQDDAAVTVGLLKAVNSPVFGLRAKVGSVPQAISLLGLRSVRSLVIALSVRNSFKLDDPNFMESFWYDSTARAALCSAIAKAGRGQDPNACYVLGLLADCAVPAMIKRYPGYRDFYLDLGRHEGRVITEAEREEFGTDHATVGYLLAKTWHFPSDLTTVIREHHQRPVDLGSVPGPVVVLKAAEHVLRMSRGWPDEYEWAAAEEQTVCEYLSIDQDMWARLACQAA